MDAGGARDTGIPAFDELAFVDGGRDSIRTLMLLLLSPPH